MAETRTSVAARAGLRVSAPDPWAALRVVRLGCVQYLNSRPLIQAYDGQVTFEHPSALAGMLRSGALDAALVPVFEAVRDPGYLLVDGVAVAADGPVYSVFLAYRGALQDVQTVALDPASLSSAHLLQVLLAEYHGLQPAYGPEGDAKLLIGNQAIEFRVSGEAEGWNILDLGEEWKRCTGLPFVFAVWALRAATPNALAVASTLRALKTAGLARIGEIVASDPLGTPALRMEYLTKHIQFDVGPRGREAVDNYRSLLKKYQFIPTIEGEVHWLP